MDYESIAGKLEFGYHTVGTGVSSLIDPGLDHKVRTKIYDSFFIQALDDVQRHCWQELYNQFGIYPDEILSNKI